jgi:dTDP-4-amino-4,6-dideoxy-D-galactose acyltransferase
MIFMNNLESVVTFNELKWDTSFFGVTSAKAILHRSLSLNEWAELKSRFKGYQFISIMNKNSEPINAQMIGKDTSALLVDVNIQFEKQVEKSLGFPKNINIHQALERNDKVVNMADFQYSKFIEDPELAKRGGDQVYRQWIINSFNNADKFYAISSDENCDVNGFLLHSYSSDACTIELIAVSPTMKNKGTGTRLFKAVEYEANNRGLRKIKVGTQLRNMDAINFYHKVGCKQVGSHQVYHLWNI